MFSNYRVKTNKSATERILEHSVESMSEMKPTGRTKAKDPLQTSLRTPVLTSLTTKNAFSTPNMMRTPVRFLNSRVNPPPINPILLELSECYFVINRQGRMM